MELSAKTVNDLAVNYFGKTLHIRCLIGFSIQLEFFFITRNNVFNDKMSAKATRAFLFFVKSMV